MEYSVKNNPLPNQKRNKQTNKQTSKQTNKFYFLAVTSIAIPMAILSGVGEQ